MFQVTGALCVERCDLNTVRHEDRMHINILYLAFLLSNMTYY
jgi:hypothetical protein